MRLGRAGFWSACPINASTLTHRASAFAFDDVPAEGGEIIRQNSRSFAFASRLLPASVRDDVKKLYAWCRWCDDAVDSCGSADESKQRLALLREDVQRIYRNEPTEHRASAWLAELVDEYGIDEDLPRALLDGMEMDLKLAQVSSEGELLRYCCHAAGVMGLMMCKVFEVTDPHALLHAKSLGIAMQLTNIARDVREDWQRGRCYLPQSWLPHGVDASSQDEVHAAVRRILDLAEDYYEIGNEGMVYLPSAVRPAIRVAAAVYREIGMQIRRCDYRVLQGRIVTPQFRFFSSAVMAWASGVVADGKKYLGLLKSHPSVSICRHLGAVDTVLRMFAVRLARGKIMTTLAIFVLGLIVTVITGAGAILIGLQEASDPSQSRVQDLTDLERKIVGRDEKAG